MRFRELSSVFLYMLATANRLLKREELAAFSAVCVSIDKWAPLFIGVSLSVLIRSFAVSFWDSVMRMRVFEQPVDIFLRTIWAMIV